MMIPIIEAVLFAAAKPLSASELSKNLEVSVEVVNEAIEALRKQCNVPESGIHVLEHNRKYQLVSNPDLGEDVAKFLKREAAGPLTRPSLETLTIIAYRGPITKPEIEMIRGVNCSLIIRNLLIRGYIEEQEDRTQLQNIYTVSSEFLQKLGLTSVEQLSEYEAFSHNEKISELIARGSERELEGTL